MVHVVMFEKALKIFFLSKKHLTAYVVPDDLSAK
jgi:hypothetical protein